MKRNNIFYSPEDKILWRNFINNSYLYNKDLISLLYEKKNNNIKRKVPILDLHGLSAQKAYEKIINFLLKEKTKVIIITGKGNGILRREFIYWMETSFFIKRCNFFKEKHIGVFHVWLKD